MALEFVFKALRDLKPAVVRCFLQHACARLHKEEVHAVAMCDRGHVAGAVLHVAHTLGRHRMGGDVRGACRFVPAVVLLQPLEERFHAERIESGVLQR